GTCKDVLEAEGPVAEVQCKFLGKELPWTARNVVNASNDLIYNYKVKNLLRMTDQQLETLKRQQDQMKQDVLHLKDVNTQLKGAPACDTTKLVAKEPGPQPNSTPTSPTTAKRNPPPNHPHTGLIVGGVLLGAGAAGGAAAYELSKQNQ